MAEQFDDPMAKVEIPPVIMLNGKRLETEKAQPLTLGHQRKLKAKGINLSKLDSSGDPDAIAELFHLFCISMNPDITMDDIDCLTNSQMLILGKLLRQVDQKLDRPS